MRILDGFFLLWGYQDENSLMKYNKPPLSYANQVKTLQSRGLIVSDEIKAEQFLAKVNYYRFSAYCLPFENERHKFKDNTTFTDVESLYKFDRQLRQLIDNALEIIEIYLRAKITYVLTSSHGPFVHEDSKNFFNLDFHSQWLERVHEETTRSKETFVIHYRSKYDDFPKLPLWMAVEVMSFGALSKLFSNLKRDVQAEIGKALGFHHSLLVSWIHSMNFVRNVCAHHARLWNREIAISMKLPKSGDWKGVVPKRIGSILYIVNSLLKTIPSAEAFRQSWQKDIEKLLKGSTHSSFILRGMAFSTDHILWRDKNNEKR